MVSEQIRSIVSYPQGTPQFVPGGRAAAKAADEGGEFPAVREVKMFYSMSKDKLTEKGAILIENVEDGFRQYESVILKGKKQAMKDYLVRCLEENAGQAFADFYYPVFDKDRQRQFEAGLSTEEKAVFLQFETGQGEIYYPLQRESLDLLSEITARNWLFSTFFFTGHKAVVWGNYNLEYPLFCEERGVLDFYKNMAAECGLELL